MRSIADPLGEFEPGVNLDADVNEDGVIDFQDSIDTISHLSDLLGPEALGQLTPSYFDDDSNFPWDQPTLDDDGTEESAGNGRRGRYLRKGLQHATDDLNLEWMPASNRRLDTCGAQTALSLAKGTGSKPTINWDVDNCALDMTVWENMTLAEKAAAYASWAKYAALLAGAFVFLPEGAAAYQRYRSNTGVDLFVDYEEAISDDSVIKERVDTEIADVINGVKELFDGDESSFNFHSTSARSVPNGDSENWQKALGGHRIWSEGNVIYNQGDCKLDVEFTINVEDYYNFNPGQVDIASGLPDDDNCLFAIIGWANPFYSRGSISRSETIDLVCCEDSECGDPTEFDCECNLCVTQCPTNQSSGGQGFTSFSVDLFKTSGTIEVSYQMYIVPDELTIYYEGNTIFSTGGLVSGGSSNSVTYGSPTSTSTVVTVEVNAPNSGTQWVVSVTCPP